MTVFAGDWPQYRGPTTDAISTELIAASWTTTSPGFVVWTNRSLTNGFSSFAVSGGRAFTLKSVDDGTGTGTYNEFCAAVDAATGTNLWSTYIDTTPWDPTYGQGSGAGGEGKSPCDRGDGPRSTPAVKDGQVFVLSAADTSTFMLVSLNATNGSVIWSNNLSTSCGASLNYLSWEGGASPRLDNDLIFVNCNSATSSLLALRTSDGSLAWRSPQNEKMTHSTPTVATIGGTRQVLFATQSGLVSLNRDTGSLLWKYTYPFTYGTALGASPVVYSNIVFVTMGYGKGSAAAQVTVTNGVWTVTQLWAKASQSGVTYNSTWMAPVCYQGLLYGQFSDKGFTNSPLVCLELATGNLRWSTNNFGMGGAILVNTNILVITEDGALVLIQPNPSGYTQLARYQAFRFTSSVHGKCWNSPAYSNGRIYARSTTGGIAVDVSVTPPPLITTQPRSRAAVEGGSASFFVGAASPPANSYQWRFFGTNSLAAQTNATLNIPTVHKADFGNYSAVVSNSSGSVTSAVASLTLAVAPSISGVSKQLSTFSLTFLSEFGPTYFIEYKDALDAPAWLPLTNMAGDGTPGTITDNSVTNAGRFYRVRTQ
jgi:outer membrane protein assembly factor BamB